MRYLFGNDRNLQDVPQPFWLKFWFNTGRSISYLASLLVQSTAEVKLRNRFYGRCYRARAAVCLHTLQNFLCPGSHDIGIVKM